MGEDAAELVDELGTVAGRHYGESGDAAAVADALETVAERYRHIEGVDGDV
jgi:hypothetical protein